MQVLLWTRCSRRQSLSRYAAENFWRKTQQKFKNTISVKEHERARYDFDPTMFYECRFWNRRPDGIVIIKYHPTLYILEFKRSSDRDKDFLRVKEDEVNKQHKSIVEALKAAAPEWTFEQINFVAGRRGAVLNDDSYKKLDKLNVQAGKRDKILLTHVQRICEAHPIISKYMGRLGLTRRCRWRTLENKYVCK